MPNLAVLEDAKKRRANQERAHSAQAQMAHNKRADLVRYEKIRQLFGQEAWELLRDMFLSQFQAAQEMMLREEPIDNAEMQVLRSQMIVADRIINLDVFVAERVESLRKQLSPDGPQADEPGTTGR